MLHFTMNMPLYLMTLYGSIIIAVILLLRVFLRDRVPKFVFPLLWAAVFIRLLVPFSLSSPLSAPVPDFGVEFYGGSTAVAIEETSGNTQGMPIPDVQLPGQNTENTAVASSTAEFIAEPSIEFHWRDFLLLLLLAGALAVAGTLLFQWRRYSLRLKDSLLLEQNYTVNSILSELGMEHLLVFSCDAIASPLVSGILHPRIYLPTRIDFQNATLLKHILTHEAMHIKRGDNWVKLLMLLTLCLNWYNPLVWLMSKCLSADLEAACDAAVLKLLSDSERQSYASSLLSMAVSTSRSTLLYSAFSKTQVERRIKGVLRYKRATILTLTIALAVALCGTVVFATVGQAPFSQELSSYCAGDTSRWGVKATLTRGASLGENPQERADRTILHNLKADTTGDPAVIEETVRSALAKEFGVEKSAFQLDITLMLSEEALMEEYRAHGLTKTEEGTYLYQGEAVRTYADKMLGSVQTRKKGRVDISVERDQLGIITEITALHNGDKAFDKRTAELEKSPLYQSGEIINTQSIHTITPQITAVPDLSFTSKDGKKLAVGIEQEALRELMGGDYTTERIGSYVQNDHWENAYMQALYWKGQTKSLTVYGSLTDWSSSLGVSPGNTVAEMKEQLGEPTGTITPNGYYDILNYCYFFKEVDGQYVLQQNPYTTLEEYLLNVYENTSATSFYGVTFIVNEDSPKPDTITNVTINHFHKQ